MKSASDRAKRRRRAIALSVAAHAAVLVAVVVAGMVHFARRAHDVHPRMIAEVDIAGGRHATKLPHPIAPTIAHTRKPEPNREATTKTQLPVPPAPRQASGGGSPAKPTAGNGASTALLGNGSDKDDIRPAFPVFSPRPPVSDRSLLPASEQKIVVDVDVDDVGSVISETLVHGLGNRLDQSVLEIVKTWRFHPATVNGKPVASQAELIFPFNLDYPLSDS